jgi:hypothetical protein
LGRPADAAAFLGPVAIDRDRLIMK